MRRSPASTRLHGSFFRNADPLRHLSRNEERTPREMQPLDTPDGRRIIIGRLPDSSRTVGSVWETLRRCCSAGETLQPCPSSRSTETGMPRFDVWDLGFRGVVLLVHCFFFLVALASSRRGRTFPRIVCPPGDRRAQLVSGLWECFVFREYEERIYTYSRNRSDRKRKWWSEKTCVTNFNGNLYV